MKKRGSYAAAAAVFGCCAVCSSAFSPAYHRADTRRPARPAQKDSHLSRLHRRLPHTYQKKRGRSEGPLSTPARPTPAAEEGKDSYPSDEVFESSSSSSSSRYDRPDTPSSSAVGATSLNAAVGVGVEQPKNGRFNALADKGGVSKDRLAFEELGTGEIDRLFSTLEPCDVTGFRRKPANVPTAAALIGGTAVGAGILALPAATLQAGLLPSSVGLVMMWLYMVSTALLIAEVNVNVICAQGTPGVGLIALAEQALGKGGARFTGLVYVFIHYSLLVAYMAQGGGLLTESFNSFVATAGPGKGLEALPEWAGPTSFCVAVGSLVLFFSEEFVASFNSCLVGVVLVSFAALIAVGSGGVQVDFLIQQDWSKLPSAVPVLYIAMVFHNVIPVVTTQLEGDVDKIRTAVIGGSLAPLIMFLVWNTVILGSVSSDAGLVAQAAGGVFDPLQALRDNAGSAEGSAALIGPLIAIFSEVAIITSFIGFIVGLLDFFTDVLKIPPGDTSKEVPLYGAILLPPLAVAVTDPDIFFAALDTAGTFGISLLCGVLPAAMAWQQRYGGDANGKIATLPLVPGGKATLAGIAGFAGVVIFQKLLEMAGLTVPA